MSKLALVSLDQSTANIGFSIFLDGVLESWGLLKPDWPRLDLVRAFVKDYCSQLKSEGYDVTICCESIYLGVNPLTFRQLAILMGHIQAATYECGARFELVTANEALFALTGIQTSPKHPVKRPQRKALIIEAASSLAGEPLKEDVADSIALGLAHLKKQAEPAL